MKYEEIRDQITTGSMILCHGTGLISKAIEISGYWTHVGMAVRLPEYDRLLLWESTCISDHQDVMMGKVMKGCMLTSLSARVKDYEGKIAVRILEGWDIPPASVLAAVGEYHGRPYEKYLFDLLGAEFNLFNDGKENITSLFCSELYHQTLQDFGIARKDELSDSFTPSELASYQPEVGRFGDIITLN